MGNLYQFPFDKTVEQILLGLQAKNWIVKHITVKRTSGIIREIHGASYRIRFNRDISAVFPKASDIVIPQRELCVFNDESGPVYHVYVGQNWRNDASWWFDGSTKLQARMNHEPRRYLTYAGSDIASSHDGLVWHDRGLRPNYLSACSDLGRNYMPAKDEPKFYLTADIMQDFNQWLITKVLSRVK
jgi:hypothetical protein